MSRRAIAVFLLLFVVRVAAADEPAVPRPVAPNEAPHPSPVLTRRSVSPLVAVLRQKQADLVQLQQEIRQLRAQTGTQQQILVHVEVLEASLTKMEKLGLDAGLVNSGYSQMTCGNALKLVQALKGNNVAKELAEPSIVVVDARPAQFQVGEDVPIPTVPGSKEAVEFRPVGTQLDIMALSLGDNRVRLETRIRVSTADSSRTVEINGSRVPFIQVRQIDTAVESAFGESTVLSGMVDTRLEAVKVGGKVEEVENRIGTMFVVTPSLFAEPATAQHQVEQTATK